MTDIFLSYNREDQARARLFAEGFECEGFSVWWDVTLRSGEDYDEVTEKALREAKAVVVLWSKKSVASRWVRTEATIAQQNKTLAPVMIEPCQRPIMFELTQTADLMHWVGDSKDAVWKNFVADLHRFVAHAASEKTVMPTSSRSQPSASVAARRHPQHSKFVLAAVAAVIVGALVFVTLRAPNQAAPSIAATVAMPATTVTSLAVLPFVNMSSDTEQEYFSDGLSEELLNQLAQLEQLQVAGRTSSFSFKGKNEDLRVIGDKLGVNHLLEGSVRKDGQQLRITAQLIKVATGAHLWSKTYDRKLENVFVVQEEIAKDVASALSITLGVGDKTAAEGGTTNVEAYDKYLRANALLSQLEWKRAIPIYREAVVLDPGFMQAWRGLASALGSTVASENPAQLQSEISEAQARVLALAPLSMEAQSIQAARLIAQHQWIELEALVNASIAAAPASEIARNMRINFLWAVGRLEETLEIERVAYQLDPLSLARSCVLARLLVVTGRVQEAVAEYERSKDLAGNHDRCNFDIFEMLLSQSPIDEAKLNAQYELWSQTTNLPEAVSLPLAGRLTDPAAALASLQQSFADPASQSSFISMYVISHLAAAFGDKDLAITALRRLVELAPASLFNIWSSSESGVSSDPRFKQIVQELGLVDYWRTSGNWADFCRPLGTDDFECE